MNRIKYKRWLGRSGFRSLSISMSGCKSISWTISGGYSISGSKSNLWYRSRSGSKSF